MNTYRVFEEPTTYIYLKLDCCFEYWGSRFIRR